MRGQGARELGQWGLATARAPALPVASAGRSAWPAGRSAPGRAARPARQARAGALEQQEQGGGGWLAHLCERLHQPGAHRLLLPGKVRHGDDLQALEAGQQSLAALAPPRHRLNEQRFQLPLLLCVCVVEGGGGGAAPQGGWGGGPGLALARAQLRCALSHMRAPRQAPSPPAGAAPPSARCAPSAAPAPGRQPAGTPASPAACPPPARPAPSRAQPSSPRRQPAGSDSGTGGRCGGRG